VEKITFKDNVYKIILIIYKVLMTGYLAFSIYSYFASLMSWKIEKLYKNQNNNKQMKIWLILKNIFRVTGTALLIAHLMS